jgi:nitroreductase
LTPVSRCNNPLGLCVIEESSVPPDSLTPPAGLDHTSAAALHARYHAAPAASPPAWNAVLDTLLRHRSVRAYLPDPLPPGTLETLVAAAQSASSSSNLQTWSVIAVEDRTRKARLAAIAANQKHIVQAPLFLVWLADLARLGAIAERSGVAVEGLDYLELLVVAMVDAALAAQNATVALEGLGLGAVYIGAVRNDIEAVAAELDLPARVMPLFGLCVGYPDPAIPTDVKPRLPQAVVLHRETYRHGAASPDAVAGYDEAMRTFQAVQRMDGDVWSRKVVERVQTPASLTGRHRMREALGKLGFQLR